jgi:hypothetical protein
MIAGSQLQQSSVESRPKLCPADLILASRHGWSCASLLFERSPTVSSQVIDRLPVKMTSMYPMELLLLSLNLIPLRDLPLV